MSELASNEHDLSAHFLRGLADSSRLAILAVVRAGPASVTEIVAATGLSQPNVSNHLACLRNCGHVRSSQQGRFVIYDLGDPRVGKILDLTCELAEKNAANVSACMHGDGSRSRTKSGSNF